MLYDTNLLQMMLMLLAESTNLETTVRLENQQSASDFTLRKHESCFSKNGETSGRIEYDFAASHTFDSTWMRFMPAGQASTKTFIVTGITTLPVAMVYTSAANSVKVSGIATSHAGAKAIVERLVMQTVFDV
ncbi:hypothetical protein KIN20_031060 [Parelaphostrongylus tenuis]|uniref:Uncharacterized protein n=1 Tax=Parelaphostrongylus tenuis TaxID=148309 RepID=A0AAD5R509_PARTN|nr:hypothetical protein KIN20_031060 [Parelaphostrongylus tenuis]